MENSDLLFQCREFNQNQPGLEMVYVKKGIVFYGIYKFHSMEPTYRIEIEDEYLLRIEIDFNYPNELPIVYEVGNKINKYSHKYDNDELCLGIDSEIRLFLKQNSNLNVFMDTYVTNYLFNYSAYLKYGFLPLGERSHHNEGVKEFYQEYFAIMDIRRIENILKNIINNPRISQNEFCACGSGKRGKNCHGDKIISLIEAVPNQFLKKDLKSLEGR